MMRLIIDMDDVLADTSEHLRKLFYQKTGKSFDDGQLLGVRMESLLTNDEITTLESIYKKSDFFENVPVMKDAIEVVSKLSDHYEIFIVSAAIQYPFSLSAKVNWVAKNFPDFNLNNLVLCGDKSIIKGDVMIDDNDFNLLSFQGRQLLFTSLHNSPDQRFDRINNWKEVEELLLRACWGFGLRVEN